MKFSNNWFEKQTQPLWERHLTPGRWHDKGIDYLEVGVCEGRSMTWVLENLSVNRAVGIDPWSAPRERQTESFVQYRQNAMANLKPWIDDGKVELIEEPSQSALPKLAGQGFDLIYIDGDHRAPEALLDMQLAWRLLRRRGMMVIDDMQRCWHMGRPLVFFSVQAFELIYKGRAIREWAEGRQIAFRRIK